MTSLSDINADGTRDKKIDYDFKSVFLRGLSPDGGLFVPKNIVKYSDEDLHNLSKLSYLSLATEIIYYFCSVNYLW